MALPALPGRHSARRSSCPEMTDPYRDHPLSDLQTGSGHRATLAGKQIEIEGDRIVPGRLAIALCHSACRRLLCRPAASLLRQDLAAGHSLCHAGKRPRSGHYRSGLPEERGRSVMGDAA
jgi:hypothetical protein